MPAEPTSSAGAKFERLVEIMARLRSPEGCAWDREQTFDSIKPYTLEETYEVLDAIDERDWAGLRDELGDYVLQAVFYAQMAQEQGLFSIADALDAINAKLIRRHPHVFGDGAARTPEEIKKRWDEIKQEEKAGAAPQGLLEGISRRAPALVEAQQIASKAAGVGFDWPDVNGVYAKLDEEIAELKAAAHPESVEDELGDLLFVVVNLARFLKVDPEQALRRANRKFRRRFGEVEARMTEQGRTWAESSLDEMEAWWQEAKRQEQSRAGD
jgi:MazG family protein